MTDNSSFHPPIDPPIHGSAGGTTFADVEDRLVEAMLVCWRDADRERAWLRVRSGWPEITRERFDYDARGGDGSSSDVAIRPASLTRREVAEMEEAFGWVDELTPDARRIVGAVIAEIARGRREVPWARVMRRLGLTRGRDGVRKAYGRAIASICAAQSRRNPRGSLSSTK